VTDTTSPTKRDIDLTEPLQSTGHLLRRAVQHYATLWTATVTAGLTSPQFAVLAVLARGEELDQRTIAEGAALDKSTCGDLVDRLAGRGLVEAGLDPGNRRRKRVRITDAGRERLEAAAAQQREVHAAALAELSDKDRAELNRLLRKMLGLCARQFEGADASMSAGTDAEAVSAP
jgi:MarR family transcriptional regulator, temperature-dependent positive regulator of motility